jgi:hypothetical protein
MPTPKRLLGTLLAACVALLPSLDRAADPAPVKLVVFDFELDDESAAGAAAKTDKAHDEARMQAVTAEARRFLTASGRFALIDIQGAAAEAVKSQALRTCGGCDASIARDLGADQSLLGLVTRVANTEYYASVQLTDARTGKVLRQQSAFFIGSDEAWTSGVRMLLEHEILTDGN